MRRPGRLQAAKSFLPTFSGKNIIRGYARWFGVDLACALAELQILGIELDPVYVQRLRITLGERERIGRARNERRRLAVEAAAEAEGVADYEFELAPWANDAGPIESDEIPF